MLTTPKRQQKALPKNGLFQKRLNMAEVEARRRMHNGYKSGWRKRSSPRIDLFFGGSPQGLPFCPTKTISPVLEADAPISGGSYIYILLLFKTFASHRPLRDPESGFCLSARLSLQHLAKTLHSLLNFWKETLE
jgi:hypothetical protein